MSETKWKSAHSGDSPLDEINAETPKDMTRKCEIFVTTRTAKKKSENKKIICK